MHILWSVTWDFYKIMLLQWTGWLTFLPWYTVCNVHTNHYYFVFKIRLRVLKLAVVSALTLLWPQVCSDSFISIVLPAETYLWDSVHFSSGLFSPPWLPSPAHLREYCRHHGYANTTFSCHCHRRQSNITDRDRSTKPPWKLILSALSVSEQTYSCLFVEPPVCLSASMSILWCLQRFKDY